MTNNEAKQAFKDGCAVVCDGISYNCISALTMRKSKRDGSVYIQAELLDKCGNSVTIARVSDVERR